MAGHVTGSIEFRPIRLDQSARTVPFRRRSVEHDADLALGVARRNRPRPAAIEGFDERVGHIRHLPASRSSPGANKAERAHTGTPRAASEQARAARTIENPVRGEYRAHAIALDSYVRL